MIRSNKGIKVWLVFTSILACFSLCLVLLAKQPSLAQFSPAKPSSTKNSLVIRQPKNKSVTFQGDAGVAATIELRLSGEPVLEVMPSCDGVPGPKNMVEQIKWDILRTVLTVFKALSVPFLLDAGSLLFLVRECSLGDVDMDLNVESSWWRSGDNQPRLQVALEAAGLKKTTTFGNITKFGYEERWVVKGFQVDMFASDSPEEGLRRTALWTNGGFVFPCIMKQTSYVWYVWWGYQVKLPFPLEPALVSMYGETWTTPSRNGYFKYKCKCNNTGLGWPTPDKRPGGC